MTPMLEDSLTLPIVLCGLGAALAWVVGWVCLIFAAVRRGGRGALMLGAAAVAQAFGGPLVVSVAYWSALSWMQRFGADGMASAQVAQLAPAALVVALVVAATDALVLFAGGAPEISRRRE